MNTFNKKSLYAAVAGLSALGATGLAQAVSVNPDGLGQVLIYPYYTVREASTGAAYNSLLTVVNSTASAKSIKVRFLEGKNSREVLDFNLYLSKKDVWTAAIVPTADGAGIFTTDRSCVRPLIVSEATPAAPLAFVNFAYTGSSADGGDTSLDRTREGYVELIEMGDIAKASPTETNVTHSPPGGTPPGCADLTDNVGGQTDLDTGPGSGGLFGSMTLINVFKGTDYAYDATALDAFSLTSLWRAPGDVNPTLQDVNPKVSVVTTGPNTYVTTWNLLSNNKADPVSAVLMHDNVYNEFVLETGTASGTDWVLTMPTKRFYINSNAGGTAPGTLFQRNFNGTSCDDVAITQYDREEKTTTTTTTISPPPPTQTDSICYEATVVAYKTSANPGNVFASKNVQTPLITVGDHGWIGLNFNSPPTTAGKHFLVGGASTTFNTSSGTTGALTTTTFMGLPVIGFAAISFNNNTLTDATGVHVNSAFGGNLNHKFTRAITGQ